MEKLLQKYHLVDLQKVNPRILVDLVYATSQNFTGHIVYTFQKCYMRKEAASALSLVQEDLEKLGFGLKVWDGYRPMQAQQKFWDLIQDERYVAPPSMGGRHTRGTAVDLTIVTKDGKELPMPTKLDDFNESAHRDYMNLPKNLIENREFLEKAMKKRGFTGFPTECWHFDFDGWEKYPVIADLIL